MTDIDFDELDKAVNSLMGKSDEKTDQAEKPVPTTEAAPAFTVNPQPTTPAMPSQPATPVASASPTPVASTPVSAPAAVKPGADQAPKPANLATKRSAGRFMDMVHPQSDMINSRPMASAPSRQGATLQPGGEAAVDMLAGSEDKPADDLADKVSNSLNQSATGSTATPKPPLTLQPLSPSEKPAENKPEEQLTQAQESPFLPDAVVEKRPLGEPMTLAEPKSPAESEPKLDAPTPTDSPSEKPVDQPAQADDNLAPVEPSTPSPSEPLAPELGKDIMALEASAPEDLKLPADLKSSETKKPEPQAPKDDNQSSSSSMPVSGDIPQQYKAEESIAPDPAPVFEAAAQQPPEVQHKPKGKSGWFIVMIIILLLILGAGGGVAAYFLLLN
ncbi:hypothetical protein CR969_00625 [Candidatus Saccharibacteria bacterium]|nr:MAG: hypothetical protein CR969_00625 [Candidatus Saccharibacteria bacterium]